MAGKLTFAYKIKIKNKTFQKHEVLRRKVGKVFYVNKDKLLSVFPFIYFS